MENTQNPGVGNENFQISSNPGALEEKARGLGRKVDSASARLHATWGDATSQVRSKLGNTTDQLKYKLQVAGEQTKRRLVMAKDRTALKAKDYRVNVEHKVQEHPIKSIAYAFGAGAVIGLLLRRTRR